MASYGYEAIDRMGKDVKGSVEANSEDTARNQLKQQGLIVLTLKEQSIMTRDLSLSFESKVKPRDLAVFCRQFVSMSRAGVSILDCLNLLREQAENKRLARAIREIQTEVEKGETLASAMSKQEKIFSNLMVTTVAAGEESGSLEISLERMAEQYEKSAKSQALIKKAMIYPVIVALVAVAVVVVMLVVVIPRYSSMFEELGTDLPAITKNVVAVSDFLIHYWFVLVPLIIAAVAGIRYFLKTPTGQLTIGRLALKVPIVKNLTVKFACTQMARTLSTLLSSGVSMVEAVDIVAKTMQNVLFRDALFNARDEIIKGVPLSQPLEQSNLFPPMLYHMVRIGEESGNTEEMLDKLADYYDEEVELATQSLMAALEPIIILVMAAIVGVLIASVMAPVLKMYQALDTI